jgi:hypothetical protein
VTTCAYHYPRPFQRVQGLILKTVQGKCQQEIRSVTTWELSNYFADKPGRRSTNKNGQHNGRILLRVIGPVPVRQTCWQNYLIVPKVVQSQKLHQFLILFTITRAIMENAILNDGDCNVTVMTLSVCNSRPIYPALDVFFFCTMLSCCWKTTGEAQESETKTLIVLGVRIGGLWRGHFCSMQFGMLLSFCECVVVILGSFEIAWVILAFKAEVRREQGPDW